MSGGGGFERVVAEGFEDVIAAFEQFAGEREAGAVAADPLGQLEVVVAVGTGGEPGSLCGFIQRPAQRGWSLAGEVAWGAVLVGLVDGDVQSGVAHGVAGAGEAAGVAELGEDRDRGQLPDPVDLSCPGIDGDFVTRISVLEEGSSRPYAMSTEVSPGVDRPRCSSRDRVRSSGRACRGGDRAAGRDAA